jgi:hypothetical protein
MEKIIALDMNRRSVAIGNALKVAVLGALAFTAVQSVLVPRGLYADGAYNLWLVLNTKSFEVIGSARTFAILLNQLPVVSAMTLGVRDLDALIKFYSFGVAAVPVLMWLLALVIQFRRKFFWPLAVIYSATFLNSGFIAIGEYTYAFALVALSVSVLTVDGPIRRWLVAPLVFSSTALILCYEGMAFLGLPLLALALIRLRKRSWVADGESTLRERLVLWYVVVSSGLAVAVGALSIVIRTRDSGDTNLAGALNVSFAFDANQQWRLSAAVALLLVLSLYIRHKLAAVTVRLILGALAVKLFASSVWAPVWLHYNTRSLATYTFFVLLVVSLLALVLQNRRSARAVLPSASGHVATQTLAFGLAACVLFFSMSTAFWSKNQDYRAWIDDLQHVVLAGSGPIAITSTDLYTGDRSQYSWGWTNPYLSALLQSQYGQGLVLSHVESLDKFSPISPASSPQFFERYHRNVDAAATGS